MRKILLIGILVFSVPSIGRADIVEREDAMQTRDGNIEFASKFMNTPSPIFEETLIWGMARPIGDDPRVLDAFVQVITKSSNTANVRIAVDAIDTALGFHRQEIPKSKDVVLADALRRALRYDDFRLRHSVASAFESLGPEYEDEVSSLYRQWLSRARQRNLPVQEQVKEVGCYRIQEALDLCKEVVEKSSDTAAISDVLISLGDGVSKSREPIVREKARPALLDLISRIAERRDVLVGDRTRAAEILSKNGRAEEAYRLDLKIISDPGRMGSPSERWSYVWLVRKVIEMNRPDSIPALRNGIVKYHARETLQKQLHEMYGSSIKEWQGVMDKFNSVSSTDNVKH
jgi:hypothetical protein